MAAKNLGTCPACFNEQCLKDGKMVLHGYRRPGFGWIEGKCFGVEWRPYEVSNEGTIGSLVYWRQQLEEAKLFASLPEHGNDRPQPLRRVLDAARARCEALQAKSQTLTPAVRAAMGVVRLATVAYEGKFVERRAPRGSGVMHLYTRPKSNEFLLTQRIEDAHSFISGAPGEIKKHELKVAGWYSFAKKVA